MINKLSIILGTEDKGRAFRIFKSVLHTIRDFVTTEESLKLSAKLPSFAKIVYEESWKERSLIDLSCPKTVREFTDKVKENHSKLFLGHDFVNDLDIEKSCRMVLRLLKELIWENKPGASIIPDRIDKLFAEESQYRVIKGIDIINNVSICYN